MIRSRAVVLALTCTGIHLLTSSVGAQQYVTDDAALTDYRACQIQLWHGQRSSQILPACTPVHNLELSVGLIAVWKDGADGHFEYTAQTKTLFKPMTTDSWGAGLAIGVGRDPAFSGTARGANTVYAYVPLSLPLAQSRIVLHENLGWLYRSAHGIGANAITYAVRGDAWAWPRLAFIGEVYGAVAPGPKSAETPAEFQLGVRSSARSAQFDLSYGAEVRTRRRGPGWTIGLSFTTPPFL